MRIAFLGLAIILICLAHWVRILRWGLLIGVYETPEKRSLVQSLSIGYLISYFLPYKLGDLARAWISGRRMRNGKALGFASVIVDRYLDIIVVGVLFLLMYLPDRGNAEMRRTVFWYFGLSVAALLAAGILFLCKTYVKRWMLRAASIFNPQIQSRLLRSAWALIWSFKNVALKISKKKMFLSTCGMWALYLLSYACFARFLTASGFPTSFEEVFAALFTESALSASTGSLSSLFAGGADAHLWMSLYMVLPLIVLLLVSLRMPKRTAVEELDEDFISLVPHLDSGERLTFLERYFLGESREYIEDYLRINQGISIIRDYSAGSMATTLLCTDGRQMFFRKYAFDEEGRKLAGQIEWIERYRGTLPLPEIIGKSEEEHSCYYDMPYYPNSVGMFEYIHTASLENSREILEKALTALDGTIHRENLRAKDAAGLHAYIEQKVTRNLEKIAASRRIRALMQYPELIINGEAMPNLEHYRWMLEEPVLGKIFEKDICSEIHGDLTVENIICLRTDGVRDSFYLIDPNPSAPHATPYLDYAKLLQSLHGEYELYANVRQVQTDENRVNYLIVRSEIYFELHKWYRAYLMQRFGQDGVRSIYFHEAIHWLRLMPYKLEKDEAGAVLYYCGLLHVLRDLEQDFGTSLEALRQP